MAAGSLDVEGVSNMSPHAACYMHNAWTCDRTRFKVLAIVRPLYDVGSSNITDHELLVASDCSNLEVRRTEVRCYFESFFTVKDQHGTGCRLLSHSKWLQGR